MTAFGFHQRLLEIDLNKIGQHAAVDGVQWHALSESRLRNYLGGSGLGVSLLLDQVEFAQADPLSPNAAIVFAFSPLVGSPITTSAKFAVVSKSPLTDRINDSLASSRFAIQGKRAGCDAIRIVGKAPQPVVIIVDDGAVRVEPAGEIWGMECSETQAALSEKYGSSFAPAVIGPAGENLVRYATISHDGRHAGRGGSGAVLGAKNVKAILVRGKQQTAWAEPEKLSVYAKQLSARSMGAGTAKYRELGTISNLSTFNRLNALPSLNFQQGHFDAVDELGLESLRNNHVETQKSCAACTIGCEHVFAIDPVDEASKGKTLASNRVRVEYESVASLGSLVGVSDRNIVLQALSRCDELGLDTISTGGTIAFAMECAEREIIDQPNLRFGAGEILLEMIDAIGYRVGFGSDLAEGSRRLAHSIGQGTIDFAPQVKGLEIPGYEPRALQMMALGFAVGSRGADHNRSGAYEVDFSEQVDRRNVQPESVHLAIETEDRSALFDSMILCKFLRGVFDDPFRESSEMLQLVAGWDCDADELLETAQRVVTAKKWFNIQAGWVPGEDTLPNRMLQQHLPDDVRASLSAERLRSLVLRYNNQRGYTDDGYIDEGHDLFDEFASD